MGCLVCNNDSDDLTKKINFFNKKNKIERAVNSRYKDFSMDAQFNKYLEITQI